MTHNTKHSVVFDFLVYRQEGVTPNLFTRVVMKFDPEHAPGDMKMLHEQIMDGVEAWVRKTDNGRIMYEYAGDGLNFGDLAAYTSEVERFIIGCTEFRLESLESSGHFTYDSSLCRLLDDVDMDLAF